MAGEEFSDHCVMSSIGVGTGGGGGGGTGGHVPPQYFGSLYTNIIPVPPPNLTK